MKDQKTRKEPYETPVLRVIELRADEVLATGCKTAATPAFGNFAPPCWLTSCNADGS